MTANGFDKKLLINSFGIIILTIYAYVNYFKKWYLNFTVSVSEEELMAGVNEQIITSTGVNSGIAVFWGKLIITVMNQQIIKSMNGMALMAKEVAKGNFKHTFEYQVKAVIKNTVDSMNDTVNGLADMIREFNTGVCILNPASDELNHSSDTMSDSSETTVLKINTVASAAEEMSINMESVAASMAQASINIEVVVTGTGDMNQNFDNVTQNSNYTKEITCKSGAQANATIEAARAGDEGKGVAVVAHETKNMAEQTVDVTEEIAQYIQQIQDQIKDAVSEISEISQIIHQINEFVNETAVAIDQQAAITADIPKNIIQISKDLQGINANVGQSSEVSGQVPEEISDVFNESQEINNFSSKVKEKVQTLTGCNAPAAVHD